MKKIILAAAVLAGTFALARAEDGIAYVNFDRVYQESKIVRQVRDSINGNFKEREDALRGQGEKIRGLGEAAEKDKLTLNDDELEKRRGEIERMERNFVRDRRALVEDRGVVMQERRRAIDAKIAESVEKVARQRGYSIVLNPFLTLPLPGNRTLTHNIILFADAKVDITDDVIAEFDATADAESLQ
ncbi:MAG: OmpH family outer membrane protein [Betaproteobacteria bacterium]|nr:OmpH family outer membrane protein [Betaproteobacteria bacterium]